MYNLHHLLIASLTSVTLLDTLIDIIIFLAVCLILFMIVIIVIRLKNDRFKEKVDVFTQKYNASFFDYLGSNKAPDEFLSQFSKSQIKILLHFLQDYFKVLNGKELAGLENFFNNTWIYKSLLDDLNSKSRKRILRAIYFFGLAKNQEFKPQLAKFLSKKDPHIFYQSARSLARMNAAEFAERILAAASIKKKLVEMSLYQYYWNSNQRFAIIY